MKIKAILILISGLAMSACTVLQNTSEASEIKKGDGAVYECNGEGSCYQVK